MIKLIVPPSAFGLAGSSSPPSMKLETWLRIAGQPYEITWPPTAQAPKGKFPFIDDGSGAMGDSTLIIEHIKRARGVDPDEGLSPSDRAVSLAFRRMIKENTYWVIMYGRWIDPIAYPVYQRTLAAMFVPPGAPEEAMQEALGAVDGLRQTVKEQLHAHGLGRHTDEEIHAIGVADVTAICDFLADKPFFMGEKPTTADAAVYAYMANLIEAPFENPPARAARSHANLVAYCARMRARFFAV